MLASIGRAAARRVVASSKLKLKLNTALASRSAAVIRPVTIRSFSVSRWNRLAAKSDTTTATKTATKKRTAKKTVPKKKAVKAKKPAAKKKVKKVLTAEQKEKAKVNDLRKTALLKDEPKLLPTNSWAIYVSENMARHMRESSSSKIGEAVRSLLPEYQNMSYSDKQHLESRAKDNVQTNARTMKSFVESRPVEEIYLANLARRALARRNKTKRFPQLADDRLPKRPTNTFALFVQSRGNFGGGRSVDEIFKEAGREWHSLPDTEKDRFAEQYREAKEVYDREFQGIKAKALQKQKDDKAAARASAKTAA